MKELMSKLLSLYGSLKVLHYTCTGKEYYAMHLLADRLIHDIAPLEVIDHLNEYMLGRDDKFIPFDEIMHKEDIADTNPCTCMRDVRSLLANTIRHIEGMKFDSKAIESYLTGVEDSLMSALGFINRTVGE